MPPPPTVFALASALVLPCWIALVASLFWERLRTPVQAVTGFAAPALLAVAYGSLILTGFAQAPQGGFGSIAAVRALFASDAGLTAGWLHYLAFDLVIGTLIAREGLRAGVHPLLLVPCLPLTFMLGPIGYLLFLVLRFAAGLSTARTVER